VIRSAITRATDNALLRETGVYLAGFVGVAAVRFLAIPVFSRALGPVDYGELALVLAVTTGLATLTGLGGDVALSRFWFRLSAPEDRRSLVVTWILFLTGWSVLVVVTLSGVLVSWGVLDDRPQLQVVMVLGLAGMVPAQLGRLLAQVLRNQFRAGPYAALTGATAAIGVLLGILAVVVWDKGVAGAVAAVLVAEVVGALAGFAMVRSQLAGSLRLSLLPQLLRFSLPIVPTAIAQWVLAGADRIAVERYLGAGSVGPYAVAASLVMPIAMLLYAVGQAWLPRVTSLYEADHAGGLRLTARVLQVALLGYGAIAVVLGLVAPQLMVVVAGEDFAAGAAAMPLLALGAAFWGTVTFTATGYLLARRTGLAVVAPITAAILALALLAVLVPAWGVVGAAAAVMLGYLTLTSGMALVSARYVQVPAPWPQLVLVTAALIGNAAVATRLPGSPSAASCALATMLLLGLLGWRLLRDSAPSG
jgi:O-antigen/teichoic acid export membrane protein